MRYYRTRVTIQPFVTTLLMRISYLDGISCLPSNQLLWSEFWLIDIDQECNID